MRELLAALASVSHGDEIVSLVNQGTCWNPGDAVSVIHMPNVPSAIRLAILLPWMARRHGFDVLHTQYAAPPWSPCPTVVSVHDIGWVKFPELFPALLRRRLAAFTPGALRRAARIFVLTEAIRQEIAQIYGVSTERMDVVSPGVDPRFFERAGGEERSRVRAKYRLPERFILYVGVLQPRKNLARLAAAFSRLRDRGLPHSLVLTGERTWMYGEVGKAIEAAGLGERLRFTGYVDSSELPALIQAADVFAYVSLYEGFGLPVLEALASGTPCVASTDPAISEVAGDAAVLCNPLEVDDIERGLVSALSDGALRQRLQAAGPKRAEVYSRASMASAALAGYHNAVLAT
jgi:glycosyltransferase involved in cell wall biosynthesis